MISANLTASLYLVSGIFFILALRGLSSPETSRKGNFFGIAGMAIAVVVTLLSLQDTNILIKNYLFILGPISLGGLVGALKCERAHFGAIGCAATSFEAQAF